MARTTPSLSGNWMPRTRYVETQSGHARGQAHLCLAQIISGRRTNASDTTYPRIVTLGGDHTTTLSALRSTHERWGKVSVIHFDSHLGESTQSTAAVWTTSDSFTDTWDPEVLGGGISDYA